MTRFMQGICGLILVSSLLLGSPVHALVPHEHGEGHSHGESIVWQSLHSALRHEDKKALPMFDALALVGSIALIVVVGRRRSDESVLYIHALQNALKRGILPHRKFG